MSSARVPFKPKRDTKVIQVWGAAALPVILTGIVLIYGHLFGIVFAGLMHHPGEPLEPAHLKELLPLLGNHIHDTSERVRIALLELLILVKNMRAIKVRACVHNYPISLL